MAKLPEKIKQIAITHSPLINSVVMTCQNSSYINLLEPELIKAQENGWGELVKRIRKILAGSRKQNLLKGLDEEDAGIILAILVGLQNPDAVKNLNKVKKGDHAPKAIAQLIKDCRANNNQIPEELKLLLSSMKQTGKNEVVQLESAIMCIIKEDLKSLNESILPTLDETTKHFIDSIRKELDE